MNAEAKRVKSAWQTVQIARHPNRPQFLDYISALFTDFDALHGDRAFGDDQALIGGLARFNGRPVVVVGQHRGRTTSERLHHNFGMTNPEGYRKAMRLFEMAERFGLPVLNFIDTMGAYPGVGAEQRGQAEAIARCLAVLSTLKVPVIATVIGEGGSGGALAIGVSDKVFMLENSMYSVISPEGCASILWKTNQQAERASEALGLTADKLFKLGLIDQIISEGQGAHLTPDLTVNALREALTKELDQLRAASVDQLIAARYQRLMKFGSHTPALPVE